VSGSGGIAEGRVRIVDDPTFTDVEPDEIIVCATTDPSWPSTLFLSKALVVYIGGAMSRAAIVARELGIPCVINTGNGTRVLRSGDLCPVDRPGTYMPLVNDRSHCVAVRQKHKRSDRCLTSNRVLVPANESSWSAQEFRD
jgi:phosphoenolpyruvate synthase/pyruvate phosphate dikinase